MWSVFQAGAVGNGPGPNFGGPKPTQNRPQTDPSSAEFVAAYQAPGLWRRGCGRAPLQARTERRTTVRAPKKTPSPSDVVRGGRFKGLTNLYFLNRPGPREPPKSAVSGSPGSPQMSSDCPRKSLDFDMGVGCQGQNASSQYKMPPKGPPRVVVNPQVHCERFEILNQRRGCARRGSGDRVCAIRTRKGVKAQSRPPDPLRTQFLHNLNSDNFFALYLGTDYYNKKTPSPSDDRFL